MAIRARECAASERTREARLLGHVRQPKLYDEVLIRSGGADFRHLILNEALDLALPAVLAAVDDLCRCGEPDDA